MYGETSKKKEKKVILLLKKEGCLRASLLTFEWMDL